MATGIIALITALCGVVLTIIKLCTDANARRSRDIAAASADLCAALATGRIGDAAAARRRLKRLAGGLAVILAVTLPGFMMGGCCLFQARPVRPAGPLVVGERVRLVAPGTVMTVPALQPPARQWYLVDDVGLWQWIELDAGVTGVP